MLLGKQPIVDGSTIFLGKRLFAGGTEGVDRERAGVAAEHALVGDHLGDVGEEVDFEFELLGHCLDDQVAALDGRGQVTRPAVSLVSENKRKLGYMI